MSKNNYYFMPIGAHVHTYHGCFSNLASYMYIGHGTEALLFMQ